jgi:phospho-N-acetylmuramoyl-pentapeptide-transferase
MAIGFVLLLMNAKGQYTTAMNVPFFKAFKPDLVIDAFAHNPWTFAIAFAPFYLFMVLVLVGSTNAVNLTDGLDGLAIGLMIIASSAMTALCYLAGHREFATYLELQRVPGSSELTIFCATMIGASLGFLWYNAHPAEVFMGDVGSLALGGSMGTVAVLIKQELLLPFIGGVYVMELLSVVIQVGSYKLRGKRVFKMAPIHHHFELLGWKESKVIARFWIMGLIMALFALATVKLR